MHILYRYDRMSNVVQMREAIGFLISKYPVMANYNGSSTVYDVYKACGEVSLYDAFNMFLRWDLANIYRRSR